MSNTPHRITVAILNTLGRKWEMPLNMTLPPQCK
jgi:hypothetical protein